MKSLLEGLLVVTPATILVVDLFLVCPILNLVRALSEQTKKSMRVLRSTRVSEHWKEKVLPRYAARTMKTSLLLGGWLLLLLGVFTAVLHASGTLWIRDFSGVRAVRSVDYMLYTVLVAFAYISLRRVVRRVEL